MVCGSEYGRDCDMAAGRAKPKMRTIDIHNHPNWQGHDTDALVADMDRNRIAQTWLLSWEMPAYEFQDRVMFGRDTFNCDLYDILVGLRLPQKIMRKILYGNAGKILG